MSTARAQQGSRPEERSDEGPASPVRVAEEGFETVARSEEVPERGLLAVTTSRGQHVCLFRLHGQVGALHDNCTHADFAMSEGELRPDGTIECVWHGARFDCRSGAVCRGPADEPLPVYEVKEEEGRIHVGPVRRPPR